MPYHHGLIQLLLLLPQVFPQEVVVADGAYPGLVGSWRFRNLVWEKVGDAVSPEQPSTVEEYDRGREGKLFFGGSNEIIRVMAEKMLGIETAKGIEENNEGGDQEWGYFGRWVSYQLGYKILFLNSQTGYRVLGINKPQLPGQLPVPHQHGQLLGGAGEHQWEEDQVLQLRVC